MIIVMVLYRYSGVIKWISRNKDMPLRGHTLLSIEQMRYHCNLVVWVVMHTPLSINLMHCVRFAKKSKMNTRSGSGFHDALTLMN
jgi:hypothetical protein